MRLLNVRKLCIVFIKCLRCQLYRYAPPQSFVTLLGEHATLAAVAARLNCSICSAKDVPITAASTSATRS